MLFKRLFSCLLTTLSLSSPIWSFTNPIKPSHGADPFMVRLLSFFMVLKCRYRLIMHDRCLAMGITVRCFPAYLLYHHDLTCLVDLMTTGGSKISITRAESIAALKDAEPKEVWRDDEPSRCCDVWAPEIHYMPDEQAWFMYAIILPLAN
jgi:hypothetical protein